VATARNGSAFRRDKVIVRTITRDGFATPWTEAPPGFEWWLVLYGAARTGQSVFVEHVELETLHGTAALT
jgi:hypothetical protein